MANSSNPKITDAHYYPASVFRNDDYAIGGYLFHHQKQRHHDRLERYYLWSDPKRVVDKDKDQWGDYLSNTLNIIKPMVKAKTTAYDNVPSRYFEQDSEVEDNEENQTEEQEDQEEKEEDTIDQIIADIYRDLNVDRIMNTAMEKTHLHNTCLLFVQEGEIEVITPNRYYAEYHKGQLSYVGVETVEYNGDRKIMSFWRMPDENGVVTDSTPIRTFITTVKYNEFKNNKLEDNGQFLSAFIFFEGIDNRNIPKRVFDKRDKKNAQGEDISETTIEGFPFVSLFLNDPGGRNRFIPQVNVDWLRRQDTYNTLRTKASSIASTHASPTAFFKGTRPESAFQGSPRGFIVGHPKSDFTWVAPEWRANLLREEANEVVRELYAANNVNPQRIHPQEWANISGDAASGISKQMDNIALEEDRRIDRSIATRAEEELFEVLKGFYEEIPEGAKINIDFTSIQSPQGLEASDWTNFNTRLDMGVMSKLDVIRETVLTVRSDSEALDMYRRILEDKKKQEELEREILGESDREVEEREANREFIQSMSGSNGEEEDPQPDDEGEDV